MRFRKIAHARTTFWRPSPLIVGLAPGASRSFMRSARSSTSLRLLRTDDRGTPPNRHRARRPAVFRPLQSVTTWPRAAAENAPDGRIDNAHDQCLLRPLASGISQGPIASSNRPKARLGGSWRIRDVSRAPIGKRNCTTGRIVRAVALVWRPRGLCAPIRFYAGPSTLNRALDRMRLAVDQSANIKGKDWLMEIVQ